MKIKIILLLTELTVTTVLSERIDYNYCRIPTCEHDTHVFCKYTTPAVSKACGEVNRSFLTDKEKTLILDIHNHYRWLVHTGQETRGWPQGPQPAAANPSRLEWDGELAEIAHRWSVQCLYGYAKCRDVEGYQVNQLIAGRSTKNFSEELTIQSILEDWYSEVKIQNISNVQAFRERNAARDATFHYSQMVWGKTKKIGCNAIKHTSDGYKRRKLVCNYAPSGNIEGEPIYEVKV